MASSIKVGIIGAGFIGAVHVEAVRRIPGVEVRAIAGRTPQAARLRADLLGVPRAYGSYQELLADPEIQAVHNCTPNQVHFAITRDAILAGKHVLSEKPLAMNSQETGELVRLSQRHGVVTGVCFNYRQYPLVQEMRARIASGEIGSVKLISGSYLQDWLLHDTDWNWRLDPVLGGTSRAVADISSHWMDLVQHVTGSKITAVFAELATVIPVRKKPTSQVPTFEPQKGATYEDIPITTEDYAAVLFRMENGARGVFSVSQVSAGRKNRLSVEISGSDHTLVWNQEEPQRLWIGHRDGANQVLMRDPALLSESARPWAHYPGGHEEAWSDGMKNQMHNFYSFIREGKDSTRSVVPFATFAEAHRITRLVEAILASHGQGRWVDVD